MKRGRPPNSEVFRMLPEILKDKPLSTPGAMKRYYKELTGNGIGYDTIKRALDELVEQRVIEVPNSIVIEILMDEYGIYVNEGRKTGGKKVHINVFVEWIERKAIVNGDKEVKSLAFAIQQTIHKEGIPTKGMRACALVPRSY